jgi:hypothetical protein
VVAAPVHVVEVSSNFVSNEDMLRGSVCHWCSYLKDELQASVSEIKSVSEIIKTLKDDQKHACETKSKPLSVGTCEGKSAFDSNQCCNCIQLKKKNSWKKH